MGIDYQEFKKYMLVHQYDIPSRLNYFANIYPNLPWSKAKELYRLAVLEAHEIFETNNIANIPFGKGYVFVKERFEELIQMYLKIKNY